MVEAASWMLSHTPGRPCPWGAGRELWAGSGGPFQSFILCADTMWSPEEQQSQAPSTLGRVLAVP